MQAVDGTGHQDAPDLRPAIDRCLKDKNINQAQLASEIGVHQSSVSRACTKIPKRRGPALRKICSYMQNEGFLDTPSPAVAALEEIWDGSETHARALAGIILATKDLRPERGEASNGQ